MIELFMKKVLSVSLDRVKERKGLIPRQRHVEDVMRLDDLDPVISEMIRRDRIWSDEAPDNGE